MGFFLWKRSRGLGRSSPLGGKSLFLLPSTLAGVYTLLFFVSDAGVQNPAISASSFRAYRSGITHLGSNSVKLGSSFGAFQSGSLV